MNKSLSENTLGQRIKAQRIKMGYTQEQLAELMCVPKSTISAYENDKVDIKGSVIIELSNNLKTTPDYLLGYGGISSSTMEIVNLLEGISDEKIKAMLLAQIRAVASL